ncbi:MAG TPA: DUF2147 domain-containing protein [Terracidiphilus sp.]|nr:DUF2147 domain-containing protein [Terracidiphilus sp.]
MHLSKYKHALSVALALGLVVFANSGSAQKLSPKLQNAVGHWQVIDSDGGKGGQVETYIENGILFGKVTGARPGRALDSVCSKCPGELKNQRIMGMVVIRNFHPEGDDWIGGTVVDPENGKVYKGKMWAIGSDKLGMRGFVGISLIGRTATWVRIP